ncbi:GOLD domain-containing protein [Entamoeba marina]
MFCELSFKGNNNCLRKIQCQVEQPPQYFNETLKILFLFEPLDDNKLTSSESDLTSENHDNSNFDKMLSEFEVIHKEDIEPTMELGYSHVSTLLKNYDYSVSVETRSWIGLYDKYEFQNEKYLKTQTLSDSNGSFYFEGLTDGCYEVRYFPHNDGKLINTFGVEDSYGSGASISYQLMDDIISVTVDFHGANDGFIRFYKCVSVKDTINYVPTKINFATPNKKAVKARLRVHGDFVIRAYKKSSYLYFRRGLKFSWDYLTQSQSNIIHVD